MRNQEINSKIITLWNKYFKDDEDVYAPLFYNEFKKGGLLFAGMKTKYFIIVFFVIYLAILVKLIVFKYPSYMLFDIADGNYVPLKTIVSYLRGQPTWIVAMYNIGGNIVPFIPLGFFVPVLYYRQLLPLKHVLIFAFLLSLALEGVQVFLHAGVFDIDDIILNIFGAIVGYGIFALITQVILANTRCNNCSVAFKK